MATQLIHALAPSTLDKKVEVALSGRRGFVPLQPDEERELVTRIRRGDRQAAWALAMANHNFVRSVAQRYQRNDVALEDLVSEGLLGLVEAAERFDPDRGIKFITYGIWWVKRAILRLLRTFEHAVHVPKYKQYQAQELWRAHQALAQRLGHAPSVDELSRATGMTAESVLEILALSTPADSLDADPEGLPARLASGETDAESAAIQADATDRIARLLPQLSDRERTVLNRRFGLDDGDVVTLAVLGDEVGLTKERVRQIEVEACQRLRRAMESGDPPPPAGPPRKRRRSSLPEGARLAA